MSNKIAVKQANLREPAAFKGPVDMTIHTSDDSEVFFDPDLRCLIATHKRRVDTLFVPLESVKNFIAMTPEQSEKAAAEREARATAAANAAKAVAERKATALEANKDVAALRAANKLGITKFVKNQTTGIVEEIPT